MTYEKSRQSLLGQMPFPTQECHYSEETAHEIDYAVRELTDHAREKALGNSLHLIGRNWKKAPRDFWKKRPCWPLNYHGSMWASPRLTRARLIPSKSKRLLRRETLNQHWGASESKVVSATALRASRYHTPIAQPAAQGTR